MTEHTGPGQHDSAVVVFLKQRWLTILLVVVAAVFILQNNRSVVIRVLWLRMDSPLWMLLGLMFLGGFAAGMSFKRRKGRSETRA